jgi:hypothetical protein
VSGFRYQVSGFRNQVSGVRIQESGVRCQESGIRCQLLREKIVRAAAGKKKSERKIIKNKQQ